MDKKASNTWNSFIHPVPVLLRDNQQKKETNGMRQSQLFHFSPLKTFFMRFLSFKSDKLVIDKRIYFSPTKTTWRGAFQLGI